jgi:hypothetical protein
MYYGTDVLAMENSDIFVVGYGSNIENLEPLGVYLYPTHAILIKHDKFGNREFVKTFIEDGDIVINTMFNKIAQLNSGNIVVSGNFMDYGKPSSFVSFLYLFDTDGNLLDKTFLFKNKEYDRWADDIIWDIVPLKDGGFLIAGNGSYRTTSSTGNEFGFMARYNSCFKQVWYKSIGDTTGQKFYGRINGAAELDDGRLAFAGIEKRFPQNAQSLLLVTDAWGNGDYPTFERPSNDITTNSEFIIYPNPTNDWIVVNPKKDGNFPYILYSVTGRIIETGFVSGPTKIDMNSYASGIYILNLKGFDPVRIALL